MRVQIRDVEGLKLVVERRRIEARSWEVVDDGDRERLPWRDADRRPDDVAIVHPSPLHDARSGVCPFRQGERDGARGINHGELDRSADGGGVDGGESDQYKAEHCVRSEWGGRIG